MTLLKARLEVVDSNSQLHLEQELTLLGKQLLDYQTNSHTAAASLSHRIQDLEIQNAKVKNIQKCTNLVDWRSHLFMFSSCYLLPSIETVQL